MINKVLFLILFYEIFDNLDKFRIYFLHKIGYIYNIYIDVWLNLVNLLFKDKKLNN